ncbi:MAG: hypothetical protein AVDCRST_MAG56-1966, partial [uncultured Cytophagales bacterium]
WSFRCAGTRLPGTRAWQGAVSGLISLNSRGWARRPGEHHRPHRPARTPKTGFTRNASR